jgi:hypothetical protein
MPHAAMFVSLGTHPQVVNVQPLSAYHVLPPLDTDLKQKNLMT